MINIEELVAIIESSEWCEKLKAADILAEHGSSEVVASLIALLKSKDGKVRNASTLALREIGDDIAVEPLFAASHDPANVENRSTLVYALETLDCSGHFIDVVKLAVFGKADVQMSALVILAEQGFYMDDDDLAEALFMLEKAKELSIDYALLKSLLNELGEE